MPNAFNFAASPFDCLTPDEQRLVRASVDIAYFPEGAVVLDVGVVPTHLFVIIKGYVTQTEGDEVLATYGPDDCFDGCGLMTGRVGSRFVAAEEVVAYQLAREAVNELIARNTTFGALLFSDLGQKLSALAQRADQHELQSLTLARVDQAYLRPAHTVDAGTDIVSVVRLFQAQRTTNVLVTGLNNVPGGKIIEVPMLRGRVMELNGVDVAKVKVPPEGQWVLRGDRGITYAKRVPENSTLSQGAWWPEDYSGEPLVSFSAEEGGELGLKIGDKVTVNVLGRNITARIANFRNVEG